MDCLLGEISFSALSSLFFLLKIISFAYSFSTQRTFLLLAAKSLSLAGRSSLQVETMASGPVSER